MPHAPSTRGGAHDAHAITDEQAPVTRAFRRRDELLGVLENELAEYEHAAPRDDVEAARLGQLRRRHTELIHAETGLVFGRLFADDGTSSLVGRLGVADVGETDRPLVLDWRAPAARGFYTATPLAPQGLLRRRHIRLQGRTVVAVDDEPLTDPSCSASSEGLVGEGALLAALSNRRTGRMGTAVATLQREQDDIVRADSSGPLVVQGGPGTGKTVVALHRVAYLLFSRPDLASQGVLVLGPSRRFLDYIVEVLPALGETAVVSATCATLVPGVHVNREEPREVAEIKGRADWQHALELHVESLVPTPRELTFGLDGQVQTLSVDGVARAVLAGRTMPDLRTARRLFADHVHDQLADAVVSAHESLLESMEEGYEDILDRVDQSLARSDNRGNVWGLSGADVDGALTEDDVDRLRDAIKTDRSVACAIEEYWPIPDAHVTLRALLCDEVRLRDLAPWLTEHELALVLADANGTDGVRSDRLSESDIALLDAVADLLGTDEERSTPGEFLADRAISRREWAYGHAVVDEAQELSAMQWQMVARRVPSRSITAVGDIDQTGAPHAHTSWTDAVSPVFGDRWQRRDLTICYRTPREVMALTEPVLAHAGSSNRPPRALRDSGIPPWEHICPRDRLAPIAADLLAEMTARWEGGSVGVIAPDYLIATLRESLAAEFVVTAPEAKGLEWDATLVVDPDGITREPRGWNGLYVALTRCTQELGQLHLRP